MAIVPKEVFDGITAVKEIGKDVIMGIQEKLKRSLKSLYANLINSFEKKNSLTGYKVLYRDNQRKLYSSHLFFGRNDYCGKGRHLRYYLNKWTYPKNLCGPLTVFSRLEDAENFLIGLSGKRGVLNSSLRIYMCEYDKSCENNVFEYGEKGFCEYSDLPYGTILAKRVKIIFKV